MKNVAVIFVLCSLLVCSALQWDDCGTPLTRWVSYESITISPNDDIQIQTRLSVNLVAVINRNVLPLDTVTTRIVVLKDGQLFLNTTTYPLCTLLAENNVGCVLREGQKISYTFEWDVPNLPRGNYTLRIISTSSLLSQGVGCVEAKAAVEGLSVPSSCVYTSTFNAMINGDLHFQQASKFDQSIGDFIQVGPWGSNAGSSANAFNWGKFSSITGTSDVVGTDTVDEENYVWAINGTMVNQSIGTISTHRYVGTFLVGYAHGSVYNYVEGGIFDWTFNADPNAGTYRMSTGRLLLSPVYFQPISFSYPVVVGNMNPLSLSATANGDSIAVTGSRQWCTCGNTCGTSSGNTFIRTQTSSGSGSGMSTLENGTIAAGVLGGLAVIAAVIILIVYLKGNRQPVFDPAEMVYPVKPDYGSMALGEIIDEDPHRV